VRALRAAAPLVAGIKDPSLRPEYARQLAGWLGMDVEPVMRAVAQAGRSTAAQPVRIRGGQDGGRDHEAAGRRAGGHTASGHGAEGRGAARSRAEGRSAVGHGAYEDRTVEDLLAGGGSLPVIPAPDPRDPVARVEREALECILQVPQLVPLDEAERLSDAAFEVPAHRAVHQAIRAAGGVARARELSGTAWTEAVHEQSPLAVAPLVTQLAVTPLPADTDDALARYAESVVLRLAEVEITRQIGMMRSRVQRLDAHDSGAAQAFADLLAAEARRRALRDRITGG
jgi:DNA primase